MLRSVSGRVFVFVLLTASSLSATPLDLRIDYRKNPLGIDDPTPRFSWRSDSSERNWRQSAYQIIVATAPENLRSGTADVWDSGKQASAQSVGIAYAGPALASRVRYFWKVRVWDESGRVSQSSEPAWWEMGLLQPSDWSASWITRDDPQSAADRAGIHWIGSSGQAALQPTQGSTFVFRTTVMLSEKPKDAALFILVRGDFEAKLNGQRVGGKHQWHDFDREDVTDSLRLGENSIEITVTAVEPNRFGPDAGSKTAPVGLAGLLKITYLNGSISRFFTDANWDARARNESMWAKAVVVAQLVDPRLGEVPPLPPPAALFRRSFEVKKSLRSARLYVTALGSYRMFLNGERIGAGVLTPGFTDLSKRVEYQTYDVTENVASGKNTLGAVLGEGWFASGMTWTGLPYFFQPPPIRLLAQLELRYSDGSNDTVVSDGSWKSLASPILHSQIYSGETYDAREEVPNWNQSSINDERWQTAAVGPESSAPLVAQPDSPVTVVSRLIPSSITRVKSAYVFDMKQNMVGWVRLRLRGPAGTRVRLRFAERLNNDGSIYTANLRNADATDTYVLRGGGEESYAPFFTFHGFRYVEVTGFPGTPTLDSVTGEVASSVSDLPTGRVRTASDLVNRMWGIGLWGQTGNFLSIPTDCPQRDERLGWMGDAGVFWRTGSYNFDIDAFSHKFMDDVTDGQTPQGNFTNVSPDSLRPFGSQGAPGWADAGVIIPWTVWMQYGDRAIVERNWDSMQRFMEFIAHENPNFIRSNGVGPNFADWLAPDERTNKDLLATAYWALVAGMMQQMAHAIGKQDDAKRYADLIDRIRNAFQKAYIKDDGTVGTGTQTSYVVTLYAKLAPEPLENAMVNLLVKDIESRNWHLSTGFLGTPFLLFTLADHGRTDVAYKLLLNQSYPSWGYMLSKGATTWWERWNGDTGDPSMNSYNHYAFGSVLAWVYRYLVGIDSASDGPGFRHMFIHPHPNAAMSQASGTYDSVYGKISVDWKEAPNSFSLKVSIPPNTTATIYLPEFANTRAWQDGAPISARREDGTYVVQTGSGDYSFEVK